MKKLEAVVRHFRLEPLKDALVAQGVQGMTVSEVRGFGRQRGQKETYRGAEYTVDFLPKVKIEVMVGEEHLKGAIEAILNTARTGKVGDGKDLRRERRRGREDSHRRNGEGRVIANSGTISGVDSSQFRRNPESD